MASSHPYLYFASNKWSDYYYSRNKKVPPVQTPSTETVSRWVTNIQKSRERERERSRSRSVSPTSTPRSNPHPPTRPSTAPRRLPPKRPQFATPTSGVSPVTSSGSRRVATGSVARSSGASSKMADAGSSGRPPPHPTSSGSTAKAAFQVVQKSSQTKGKAARVSSADSWERTQGSTATATPLAEMAEMGVVESEYHTDPEREPQPELNISETVAHRPPPIETRSPVGVTSGPLEVGLESEPESPEPAPEPLLSSPIPERRATLPEPLFAESILSSSLGVPAVMVSLDRVVRTSPGVRVTADLPVAQPRAGGSERGSSEERAGVGAPRPAASDELKSAFQDMDQVLQRFSTLSFGFLNADPAPPPSPARPLDETPPRGTPDRKTMLGVSQQSTLSPPTLSTLSFSGLSPASARLPTNPAALDLPLSARAMPLEGQSPLLTPIQPLLRNNGHRGELREEDDPASRSSRAGGREQPSPRAGIGGSASHSSPEHFQTRQVAAEHHLTSQRFGALSEPEVEDAPSSPPREAMTQEPHPPSSRSTSSHPAASLAPEAIQHSAVPCAEDGGVRRGGLALHQDAGVEPRSLIINCNSVTVYTSLPAHLVSAASAMPTSFSGTLAKPPETDLPPCVHLSGRRTFFREPPRCRLSLAMCCIAGPSGPNRAWGPSQSMHRETTLKSHGNLLAFHPQPAGGGSGVGGHILYGSSSGSMPAGGAQRSLHDAFVQTELCCGRKLERAPARSSSCTPFSSRGAFTEVANSQPRAVTMSSLLPQSGSCAAAGVPATAGVVYMDTRGETASSMSLRRLRHAYLALGQDSSSSSSSSCSSQGSDPRDAAAFSNS
eukprot:RCo012032